MALLTRTGLRINRYCSMVDFSFFRSSSETDYTSSCQILRRLVKPFRRYGRFSIFKMAAVRRLGFVLGVLGPTTKSIWWSLWLCKIWL